MKGFPNFRRVKNAFSNVQPKCAIAFELGLSEPLIGGCFVRKGLVRHRVTPNRSAFGTVIGGLDIDKLSVLVSGVVMNDANDKIRNRFEITLAFSWTIPKIFQTGILRLAGERNSHAQVDIYLTYCVAEIVEGKITLL